MKLCNPRVIILARTDRRIEHVVVGDVVTVQAVRARLKIRRCVDVTDSECFEVWNDLACLRKSEPAIELQSVGAGWNAWLRRCHRRNFMSFRAKSRNPVALPKGIAAGSLDSACTSLGMTRQRACYIFSGTLMPNKSRPRCRTRPVRSHKANRELRSGSSDFKTGQAS